MILPGLRNSCKANTGFISKVALQLHPVRDMKKEPSVGFLAMLGMTSDGSLGRGPYGEAGAAHRREPICSHGRG